MVWVWPDLTAHDVLPPPTPPYHPKAELWDYGLVTATLLIVDIPLALGAAHTYECRIGWITVARIIRNYF